MVQEPTVSQIPFGIVLVGNVEADERNTEGVNKVNQPEKQANAHAEDAGKGEKAGLARSGQQKNAPLTAEVPSSSVAGSASASASASASMSPASTAPFTEYASTPPTDTPAPTGVRPEPAARKQPDDARGDMAAASTDGPSARAAGGPDPSPGFQRKQASPVASTPPGNRISTKVKISTNVKKTEYSTR